MTIRAIILVLAAAVLIGIVNRNAIYNWIKDKKIIDEDEQERKEK